MRLKPMKFFAAVMLINFLFTLPALAYTRLPLSENAVTYQKVEDFLSTVQFSIKKGQRYDESNDPAIKTRAGGPEETSPQHGYFAVPLIVIGLAGVLLYFSKFD
jgi:hypothetical protein